MDYFSLRITCILFRVLSSFSKLLQDQKGGAIAEMKGKNRWRRRRLDFAAIRIKGTAIKSKTWSERKRKTQKEEEHQTCLLFFFPPSASSMCFRASLHCPRLRSGQPSAVRLFTNGYSLFLQRKTTCPSSIAAHILGFSEIDTDRTSTCATIHLCHGQIVLSSASFLFYLPSSTLDVGSWMMEPTLLCLLVIMSVLPSIRLQM